MDQAEWGYPPRRPFILIGGYFLVATLQLILSVWRPPLPDTPVTLYLVLAGITFVLTLLSGAAMLAKATWALPYLVGSGILVAAASAAGAAGGQGQLIAGFYLAVLGLFSGYFLSVRSVRILLVAATVAFGGALAVNLRLDSIAYIIAVALLVIGVTLVVSSLVQHLRNEAVRDPLTGALNRRGLEDAAILLRNVDERRRTETAVVAIDLNGFKAYNDTHGHQAGDNLLASAVRDWSGVLRRSDVLSRTGGDEFVLVLPATTVAEAGALVERMRAANPVDWSAGIALWAPGEDLSIVLQHADEAMYRNKPRERHQGRDLDQRP